MLSKDLVPVFYSYLVAIAVAVVALIWLDGELLMNTLWADLAATLVIFTYSRIYKNSSFYDAYWSVIPPLMVLYWALFHINPGVDPVRQFLVISLVWLWGFRLTANWASHWEGLVHEDWRYQPIKEGAGKFEFAADFAAIHLFPTLIVFAACLPAYAAVSIGTAELNWLDALAFIVTFGAIVIETVADLQLHKFVANKKPGEFIKTGLWRYSRHPNYFGELSFWIGLMLFGLAAHPEGWMWMMPGAIAMAAMFAFASIPLMDKRSVERRPEYAEHMQKVSAIVPWFSKLD